MSLEHLAFVYNLPEERVQEILQERQQEAEQRRLTAPTKIADMIGLTGVLK